VVGVMNVGGEWSEISGEGKMGQWRGMWWPKVVCVDWRFL
jgi:hypothetical protein